MRRCACVCVCVHVRACVDAGESEGQSEMNVVLN